MNVYREAGARLVLVGTCTVEPDRLLGELGRYVVAIPRPPCATPPGELEPYQAPREFSVRVEHGEHLVVLRPGDDPAHLPGWKPARLFTAVVRRLAAEAEIAAQIGCVSPALEGRRPNDPGLF